MRRYDVAELRGVERTPQGGLRIQANLTRTGVFKYRQHDGTMRRELRHPDDVFAGSSLATFRQAPVTNLHPAVGPVTPENWKTLAVGTVADDVRQDGAFVAASLAVQDADMIRLIEAGERKEISCGYDCDVVDEAGVYQGEAYDCRQTNIVGNHVALGPMNWGRAGRDVKLRLDANDAEQILDKDKERTMKTIKLDGVDYEIGSDAHLAKLDSIHAKALELEKTANAKLVETEKTRADNAEKVLATEKTRADKATADLAAATDPKALHKRVVARLHIVDSFRKASKIALDNEPDEAKRKERADADEKKAEGSSDNELMASVVKMIAPEFDSTDESEIRGAFKLVIAKLMAGGGDAETEDATAIETPSDGGDPTMQPGQGGAREGEGMDGPPPRSPVAPPRRDSIYDARGGRSDGPAPKLNAEEKMRKDNSDAWTKPLRHSRDAR